MLAFVRPRRPEDFDSHVRDAKDLIAEIVRSGVRPGSSNFEDKWKKYKKVLSEHQYDKCGYCEARFKVTSYGDIEHFAPKSRVDRLRLDERGEPITRSRNDPRDDDEPYLVERLCETGYHWLAYEWENYLFSCERCNRTHKRALFPVKPGLGQDDPPSPARAEERLLLHPYEPGLRVAAHLSFSDIGAIQAFSDSERGLQTIRTCRLDRISLTESRHRVAERLVPLLYELANRLRDYTKLLRGSANAAHENASALLNTARDILSLGEEREPHAGMVRVMFEHDLEFPWEALHGLVERLEGEIDAES